MCAVWLPVNCDIFQSERSVAYGKFPQLHIDTRPANHLFESDKTLAAIAVSRVSLAAVSALCPVWTHTLFPLVNTRNLLTICREGGGIEIFVSSESASAAV